MKRTGRRETSADHDSQHRDRWLISYADLVTLLLALFIVMYAASDYQRAHQIATSFAAANSGGNGVLPGVSQASEERAKFQSQLASDPQIVEKVKIRESKNGLVLSLSEAGVFAPGDATLGPDAITLVAALAEKLKHNEFEVRVEGHTDSVPISNAKFASNWELSTARAANVLQKLVDNGIAPERLSAAGYGGFQPIADNGTADGRAQNRRVDVVILK